MKLFRKLIQRYPYRGVFGWATACVWGFVVAEIMWHLSGFFRQYDFLEIPLVVPYAPLACIIDPGDAMINSSGIFFLALANWFGIFLLGLVFSLRRISTRISGTTTIFLILIIAMVRVTIYWSNPPIYI